jgi:hypothetical protein
MTTPLGNEYPHGDRVPEISLTDTFDHLELEAFVGLDELLAEPGLNYSLARLQIQTLAGFFGSGVGLDEPTFNRLPVTAKEATLEIKDACLSYFDSVGILDEVEHEFELLEAHGPLSDRETARIALRTMETHISIVDQEEGYRRRNAMYRGFKAAGMPDTLELPLEDPYVAEAERKASQVPYSEAGLKEVLKVAGTSLRPIFEGYAEVAPENVDRQGIVKHAFENIIAARDRTRR